MVVLNLSTHLDPRVEYGKSTAEETSAEDRRILLLELQRPHYDAIKNGRKKWEARPVFESEDKGGRETIHKKLATALLQDRASHSSDDAAFLLNLRDFQ